LGPNENQEVGRKGKENKVARGHVAMSTQHGHQRSAGAA
jgi:hypothetical protein